MTRMNGLTRFPLSLSTRFPLSLTTHVSRITDRANKITHALGRVAREKWGLKPKTMKIVYKGVVEAILTYGAEGWFNRTNCHHIRALESAQRSALVRITRCYRTTSKAALQVMAGIVPLDITFNERSLLYKYRSGESIYCNGITISVRDTSKAIAKKLCREMSMSLWQSRWDLDTDGRATYEFLPEVKKIYERKSPLSGCMVQIISGHTKVRSYLKRFGLTESEQCDCGAADQNINHILFECELMENFRTAFSELLANASISWPPPKNRMVDDEILLGFKSFAQQMINELQNRIG